MFQFRQNKLRIVALILLIASALPSGPVNAGPAEPPGPAILAAAVTAEQDQAPLEPQASGCDPETVSSQNPQYEQLLVELVNAERASQGVPPLKNVSSLNDAARYHGADMGQDNYFDHDTYDRVGGDLEYVCAWSERISGFYSGWSWLGENIAAGPGTPEGAMQLWMNSPGHRANILNPDFWELGVGLYSGSGNFSNYWVQDFGRRRNIYPLVIEGEREVASQAEVQVYVYGQWTEMRLHADAEAWSAWMPFQPSFSWTLPAVPGEHTLYAEMRTASQSASSSDSILLDLPDQNQLGNLPDTLLFTYSTASQQLLPAVVQLEPLNTGGSASLQWQVTPQANWIQASPSQGSTPQVIQVDLVHMGDFKTGTYTSSLQIEVTAPLETLDSPHTIIVTLQVADAPIQNLYLPLVARP